MNYIIIGGAAWAALEHIDIIGDREMLKHSKASERANS